MESILENDPENNINFIPCIRWIKRGVANTHPAKVSFSNC